MSAVSGPRRVHATEGTTTLLVPESDHKRGPQKRGGGPFFNPAMRVARDVSVLVLRTLAAQERRGLRVLDAMAATGARGLRLAHEVPGTRVQLNDANPEAIQLAQENAKRLGLKNVDFRIGRLESHVAAERYDWVDIDPFGTPAPFIDAAMLGVEDHGILAVTATDTATLSGVYPDACLRRYNARPRRGDCMPELAARILVGAVVRAAGRRDRGASPLLAYANQHFVRAYVRVQDGAAHADVSAKQMGHAVFGPGLARALRAEPGPPETTAGPLWAGPLGEPGFVARLRDAGEEDPVASAEARRLLRRVADEAGAPGLYYEIDDFTRAAKTNAPPLEALLKSLRDAGRVAARTHFSARGFRTDATPAEVFAALAPPGAGTRGR